MTKTVQMTLDENLVKRVDQAARKLKTSRSAFTRQALQMALSRLNEVQLEKKHRQGYVKHPVKEDEFSLWQSEQVWGD